MTDTPEKARSSVEGMLTLAVSATMLLAALAAGGLHVGSVVLRNRADDETRIRTYAALLSDQAAEYFRPAQRPMPTHWAGRLASANGLRLVAVFDHNDQLVAAYPSAEFCDNLIDATDAKIRDLPIRVDYQVGRERRRCLLVDQTIHAAQQAASAGRLVIALDPTPFSVRGELPTLTALAACTVVLNFLLLAHLNRRLLDPLRHLAQINRARVPAELAKLEPSTTVHEIQRIGQLIRYLNEALTDHRQEIAELESSVDRRVDARTRQITSALNRTQKQSWTDPLTRLYNRRVLDERLDAIVRAQREADQDLAVVMLDVDHFKQANDVMGHAAGDALLAFIGDLLRGALRESDLAVRHGGDEFVLILPNTHLRDAQQVAQRILNLFRQHAATLEISPKPSLSAGVASLKSIDAQDGQSLLHVADQTLYDAKRRGKGTVATAVETPAIA